MELTFKLAFLTERDFSTVFKLIFRTIHNDTLASLRKPSSSYGPHDFKSL